MVVEWNLLSNRTINTQMWCLLLDQVYPNEHHLPVPSPCIHCGRGGVGGGCGVILLLLIAHHTNSEWPLGWGGVGVILLLLLIFQLWIILGWVGLKFRNSVEWNLPFCYCMLVWWGWDSSSKKANRIWKIYLFLLYSCIKILVYIILSNRTINTQIWCLLLDQDCPNEYHLPVPFPYIHCDRGGVGRGWGSSSSSSLLISPLTKFVQINITYSWCPMVVEWNLLSNRTINT